MPPKMIGTIAVALSWLAATAMTREPSVGDAVIRAESGPSEIVIATTGRTAGAVDSLTWDGKEFIDSFDHGRQLQSAADFDCGGRFVPEVFNPPRPGRGPTARAVGRPDGPSAWAWMVRNCGLGGSTRGLSDGTPVG